MLLRGHRVQVLGESKLMLMGLGPLEWTFLTVVSLAFLAAGVWVVRALRRR